MNTTTADVSIAELAERLIRLEDVRAIEQLKYRYAGFCDNGYDPEASPACSSKTAGGSWTARVDP